MEFNLETIVFYFLAAFISVFSILTVTTRRMVRSATYLLFVLFGTAGIYFLLGYTFLGSVQIMVYAAVSSCSMSSPFCSPAAKATWRPS